MQRAEQDTVAGRYVVEGEIARGGMGSVLLAEDSVLGRKVAVKRLHQHLTADPDMAARFKHEALAAASLTHPGIVTVLDAGEDENGAFLVMELIEGATLAERIKAGPIPPVEVASMGAEVARALGHAHERGVVHRDVKPGNVMLLPDGRAKIADFGIAKTLEGASSTHTATGTVLGTAAYLSPEQVSGQPITPASDIYSLGLVLYEMAAGYRAFDGDSAIAVALAQQSQDPPPLPTEIPPALQAVIMRALVKDPALRFESAGDMAVALDAVADGRRPGVAMAGPAVETTGELPMTEVVSASPSITHRRPRRGLGKGVIAAIVGISLLLLVLVVALAATGGDPKESPRDGVTPGRSTSPRNRQSPTTQPPTTQAPTTQPPTTQPPTTQPPTTQPPTTPPPTTPPPTTPPPTTAPPTPSPNGNGASPPPGG